MTANLLIALAGFIILALSLAPSSAPGCAAVSPNSRNLRTVPMAGAALRRAALWTAGVAATAH